MTPKGFQGWQGTIVGLPVHVSCAGEVFVPDTFEEHAAAVARERGAGDVGALSKKFERILAFADRVEELNREWLLIVDDAAPADVANVVPFPRPKR
jgi:hypothetical protein